MAPPTEQQGGTPEKDKGKGRAQDNTPATDPAPPLQSNVDQDPHHRKEKLISTGQQEKQYHKQKQRKKNREYKHPSIQRRYQLPANSSEGTRHPTDSMHHQERKGQLLCVATRLFVVPFVSGMHGSGQRESLWGVSCGRRR